MFSHTKRFQYNAKPDAPDPIFAKQMQELIGGQWGEMSVMMGYLFQGWNCRGPAKYRDMLMDTATEEIGHVEMLATMVARLLETSPVEAEMDELDREVEARLYSIPKQPISLPFFLLRACSGVPLLCGRRIAVVFVDLGA